MKIQQKIFAGGCAVLMFCTALTSVSAGSVTTGVYQTVRHVDIPYWGGINYETTYGSKKTDTDTYATFYETYKEAALGNFAFLITSGKAARSTEKGLVYNTAILSREISSVTKGSTYYSAVSSHAYEPSNTCDVIIKFSADNLK